MPLNNTSPPPHVKVNSTMDVSCTFPLPSSSSILSVSNSIAINPENIEQGGRHPNPMVFIRCRIPYAGVTYINTHVVVNPIGFSKNKNKSIMVYTAVVITTRVAESRSETYFYRDRFYALKVVDDFNPKSKDMLLDQVKRYYAMKDRLHANLLEISSYFEDQQSKKLCIVVDHHISGSVRTMMKNRFPQGFSEDLILYVLRSVLEALKFIHGHETMHGDINAGHVYLCHKNDYGDKDYKIKLGFAASCVYEDDDDDKDDDENTPYYLPMASMSEWAAAPEVYYGNNQSDYSEKADVWLVGITALELAYGGLKVSNRNGLEAMINDIPRPSKNVAMEMFKSSVAKLLSFSSKSNVNVDDGEELVLPFLSSNSEDHCPLFSKSFIEMVMQCLTWNPARRPSVDRLLSQPFFRNSLPSKDGNYFYNALMNKTSPSS